jgi:hypothetical protein
VPVGLVARAGHAVELLDLGADVAAVVVDPQAVAEVLVDRVRGPTIWTPSARDHLRPARVGGGVDEARGEHVVGHGDALDKLPGRPAGSRAVVGDVVDPEEVAAVDDSIGLGQDVVGAPENDAGLALGIVPQVEVDLDADVLEVRLISLREGHAEEGKPGEENALAFGTGRAAVLAQEVGTVAGPAAAGAGAGSFEETQIGISMELPGAPRAAGRRPGRRFPEGGLAAHRAGREVLGVDRGTRIARRIRARKLRRGRYRSEEHE